MDRKRLNRPKLERVGSLALLAVLAFTGCQTVRTDENKIAKSGIPTEFKKMNMPPYTVEPPDILNIEVLQALAGRPITGEYLVRPDGTVNLGWYGDVYVSGLTLQEVKEKIVLHLRKYLTDEGLGLWKTDANRDALEVDPGQTDRVFVDIAEYNSKFYYVMGDVAVPGKISITGNETVLDAISNAGGLLAFAAPGNIRLVRPAPPGACCSQVLPVNLPAIVNQGDTTTNYQIMPGDRLVVFRDPIVRTGMFVDRLAAPFLTVINGMQSYTFMVRNLKAINIPIFGANSSTSTTRSSSFPAITLPSR